MVVIYIIIYKKLEVVNQVKCNFRGAKVVVVTTAGLNAAFLTRELFIFQIVIANTEDSLYAEMTSNWPLISINKATTSKPPFITIVMQTGRYAKGEFYATGIELTTHEVGAYEMTIE